MVDDIGDVAEFYQRDWEYEDARLDWHQLEHDLTWKYLEKYLPGSGSILEVGAATGRYTLELARRGYQVTAVDLSAAELEVCRARVIEKGWTDRVETVVADARDLSALTRRDYDAALLMGPLYHLVIESDRKTALRGVFERLKPGAPIFSALICRHGILGELMKRTPNWIEDEEEVRSILSIGRDPLEHPHGGFRGYFATVAEIAPLHEEIGFETIVLAGVEPAISAEDESYNRLSGRRRRLWRDLLFEVSSEPSILGASRHLLYIGRKPA